MAVYTEVSDDELEEFVAEYDIGDVVSCKGIAEGVENSNYLLQTEGGTYILTLYERRVNPADLPFFLGLMEHLAERGLACPTPLHGRDGRALRQLCGRPAVIVTFLKGMWPRRISLGHCAELGT
ncbi:MAG: phosphotransferase, partial [Actinomycetota bacterium]